MKKKFIVFSLVALLFIAGCSSFMGPRVYNGVNPHPELISVLYSEATTVNMIDDWKDVSISLEKLTDVNGNKIEFKGRTELTPGIYILTAQWNHHIGYNKKMSLKKGDYIKQYFDGVRILLSDPNKYTIKFKAKAGKTYVFELLSTLKFLTHSPDKICLTEESHNAIGAVGAKLNPDSRYPSKNAKVIACSKINNF